MATMQTTTHPRRCGDAGFSLTELLVAMAITTIIMSATMAGLSDVMKSNELVITVAQMNNSLRTGADLMIRDFLQAGSGLPGSHAATIPSGTGSVAVQIPGPPGTSWTMPSGSLVMPAVMPRSAAGPTVNGVATDVVTVLMADNAFLEVPMTAVTDTTVTVATAFSNGTAINIATGPDRVVAGQLMLISKGSWNTLVQVTNVNTTSRVLTFANNDSLRLNQTAAENGNLKALNEEAPTYSAANTRISRVRMITYYLDATTQPGHPRLVRRVNNGDWQTMDNTSGTAVAIDTYDLQFTYDINNGLGNPSAVEMSAADLAGSGACSPNPCGETQIRKINLRLTARASNQQASGVNRFLQNVVESQVSLRAMAFIDRYQP
jgi:prepilin-type N-terminal cleavage/methylation domain-containing protein